MADPAREPTTTPAANGETAGLVLAGGRSRRFGSEKAAALFRGRPMLLWSVAALKTACGAVAVSAPADSAAAALAREAGLPVLTDSPGHPRGPLAGVAAGLDWARAAGLRRLATLPCDAPLITGEAIAALLARIGEAPAAYAVTPDGPQPLVAVWRADLAPVLAARLAGGAHPAVRTLLAEVGAIEVRFEDAAPFANVNTPEGLAG